MTKKYEHHPLSTLSDEELDTILDSLEREYTEKNTDQIMQKYKAKQKNRFVFNFGSIRKKQLVFIILMLIAFVPLTAIAAQRFWQIHMEKKDFEMVTTLEKEGVAKTGERYYKIELGYIPEGYANELPEGAPYQSNWYRNNETNETFNFELYYLDETDELFDTFVQDYKEMELKNHSAWKITTSYEEGSVSENVRIFYEEENALIEITFRGSLSENEITKIVENTTLTEQSAGDDYTLRTNPVSEEEWASRRERAEIEKNWRLDPENDNIHQLNEAVAYDTDYFEITVNEVQLEDSIPKEKIALLKRQFEKSHEDAYGTETANKIKKDDYTIDYGNVSLFDKEGKFNSLNATEFLAQDGKRSNNQKVRTIEIAPKYLELQVTIKNLSDEPYEWLGMDASLNQFKLEDSGYKVEMEKYFNLGDDIPLETFHHFRVPLSSTGIEQYQDNSIENLQPGESREVTLSYVVIAENYDRIFLNLTGEYIGNLTKEAQLESDVKHSTEWIQLTE